MSRKLSISVFATAIAGTSIFVTNRLGRANAAEMVANGGFEGDNCIVGRQSCPPWQLSGNSVVTADFHSGTKSAVIGGLGGGSGKVKQTITLTPGLYYFSFWHAGHGITPGKTPTIVTLGGQTIFDQQLATHLTFLPFDPITIHVQTPGPTDLVFEGKQGVPAGPLVKVDDVSLTKANLAWASVAQKGDWTSNDAASTSGAVPKLSVNGNMLCDESHAGAVAVCWTDRTTGYPSVPAGYSDFTIPPPPPAWCAYKTANINVFTPRNGASPGWVYVCGAVVK